MARVVVAEVVTMTVLKLVVPLVTTVVAEVAVLPVAQALRGLLLLATHHST